MEKSVKGTGIFAGLDIPESCRGQFVLVADGKIVRSAKSAKGLVEAAVKMDSKPAIFAVPENDLAIAAY